MPVASAPHRAPRHHQLSRRDRTHAARIDRPAAMAVETQLPRAAARDRSHQRRLIRGQGRAAAPEIHPTRCMPCTRRVETRRESARPTRSGWHRSGSSVAIAQHARLRLPAATLCGRHRPNSTPLCSRGRSPRDSRRAIECHARARDVCRRGTGPRPQSIHRSGCRSRRCRCPWRRRRDRSTAEAARGRLLPV